MGAVYLARDERLGHTIAIKETFFDEARLRREFEREGRLLASLRHPALPVVTDYFSDADGDFLVMQYIPGDDLETMMAVQGRAFETEKVLAWADQLLDALDYLHTQEQPILHRDIKPSNLKLTTRDRIVLLDFGLAKGSTGMTSVAGSRSVLGFTPHYAPLEQIHGTGTDERSDLYALAATLYHLMTGTVPPDAMGRAMASVYGQTDPLRPANETNPEVNEKVAYVLLRAMSQNREQRPRTAAEMRELLSNARRSALEMREDVPPTQPRASVAEASLKPTDITPPQKGAADKARGWQKLESTSLPSERFGVATTPIEPVPIPGTVASPTQVTPEMKRGATGDSFVAPRREEATVGTVSLSKLDLDSASTARAATRGRGFAMLAVASVAVVIITLLFALNWRTSIENANAGSANANLPPSFTNQWGVEFALVPAGSFQMGSENGLSYLQPMHRVNIARPFYMGRHEVTQAQWQRVMGSNPSRFRGDNLPVEQVSWNDAQEFIRRLNALNDGYTYRLPSEAEWEYACRAGTTGDYAGNIDSMAWYGNNSGSATHSVGQKQPNAFGLYDMHGNVWEWYEDEYVEGYRGAPADGSARVSESGLAWSRVLRGGSWNNFAAYLRSAARRSGHLGDHDSDIGFRVVAVPRQ